MADFRFIFAADAHTGRYEPGTKAWKEVLEEVKDLFPKPDFIVLGGDMVETGLDWEYEIFKNTIANYPIPVYVAMGNHESRWTEDLYQSYTKNFGSPSYSFEHKGIHFVTLDTTIYGQAYGHLEKAVLDWLRDDVESLAPKDPVVIFSHHPLAYPTEFTDNWGKVFEVLAGKNPILHLAGHGHAAVAWNFNNIPCFMAPAVMSNQYLICDVYEDGINIYQKTLGKEPSYWSSAQLNKKPLPSFPTSNAPKNHHWCYKTEGAIYGAVAVGEKEVVVGSSDGVVHCVDKQNGQALWLYKTGGMLVGEPVLTKINNEPVVILTSGKGVVLALRAADGKLIWQHQTQRALSSSPAVYKTQVYFGEPHAFTALNLLTGEPLWQKEIKGLVNVKPAVNETGVFFGAWDGYFHAHSHEGETLWQKEIAGLFYFSPSTGHPQLAGDKVIFTSGLQQQKGGVWVLKSQTGEVLWTQAVSANYCTPLIHQDFVYVTDLAGRVYAFDLENGTPKWVIELKREVFNNQPLYFKGHLLINTLRKSIADIDLETLTFRFIDLTKCYLLSQLRTDGESIFIGAFDECLYAFK